MTVFLFQRFSSANILLDEDFIPKIGDCAIVKVLTSGKTSTQTISTKLIGTPTYMPPEYLVERRVSVTYDSYSFGVVS